MQSKETPKSREDDKDDDDWTHPRICHLLTQKRETYAGQQSSSGSSGSTIFISHYF